MATRIEHLQEEIRRIELEQSQCSHSWGPATYDPEYIQVMDQYETRYHGVDPEYIPISYKTETKDRWSRTCTKCEKKQYTYRSEPIIQGHKPKF